uniref:Uncharacterized protein n=1 Tax=Romanomermis culicivorax TaxID=13658 RepID=A0A915L0B0_ROMCU
MPKNLRQQLVYVVIVYMDILSVINMNKFGLGEHFLIIDTIFGKKKMSNFVILFQNQTEGLISNKVYCLICTCSYVKVFSKLVLCRQINIRNKGYAIELFSRLAQ